MTRCPAWVRSCRSWSGGVERAGRCRYAGALCDGGPGDAAPLPYSGVSRQARFPVAGLISFFGDGPRCLQWSLCPRARFGRFLKSSRLSFRAGRWRRLGREPWSPVRPSPGSRFVAPEFGDLCRSPFARPDSACGGRPDRERFGDPGEGALALPAYAGSTRISRRFRTSRPQATPTRWTGPSWPLYLST